MFSRAAHPSSSSSALPHDAFIEDVEDLRAENILSGQRAAKLLAKASNAGITIPRRLRRTSGKNQARDLTRSKLKYSKWPDYYYFDCRTRDRKNDKETVANIPIFLPLEILEVIWQLGDPAVFLSVDNLDSAGKKHLAWMNEQLPGDKPMMFWGMHGDGIPCNYDRTESVVMISLNLPGLKGKYGRMRIPIAVLPDWAVSENTYDDINAVFAWSMRHLLTGTRPICRHDASPWLKSDKKRSQQAEASVDLDFRACLGQIRGDWDWMGKVFHFPFHNVKEGCCWLCRCKRNQVFTLHACIITHIYIYIYLSSIA